MRYNIKQDGFTLIEVMIAILILTIGILGAAAMQVSSIDGNSTANRITEAATWGGDQLETLMDQPYNDIVLRDTNGDGDAGLNNTDITAAPPDHGPANANGTLGAVPTNDFTVFWNVADDYPIWGTKTIRVLIRRNDRGIQKTITQDFTMMEPI